MGYAGPSVDTVLAEPQCAPGGVVAGNVHLRGGAAPTEIRHVTIALMPRMRDHHGRDIAGPEVYRGALTRAFTLSPGEDRALPFSIPLPYELPFTTVLGHELPGFTLGLCTEVDVRGGPDPGDVDPISVEPLRSQQWVLQAAARMGFTISTVAFETSQVAGLSQQLPFHQEIYLNPPPHYRRLDAVGLTFIASPGTMGFKLRAMGRVKGDDDSFGAFVVEHPESAETDWTARLTDWLEAAVLLPPNLSHAPGPPPPPGAHAPAGPPGLPPGFAAAAAAHGMPPAAAPAPHPGPGMPGPGGFGPAAPGPGGPGPGGHGPAGPGFSGPPHGPGYGPGAPGHAPAFGPGGGAPGVPPNPLGPGGGPSAPHGPGMPPFGAPPGPPGHAGPGGGVHGAPGMPPAGHGLPGMPPAGPSSPQPMGPGGFGPAQGPNAPMPAPGPGPGRQGPPHFGAGPGGPGGPGAMPGAPMPGRPGPGMPAYPPSPPPGAAVPPGAPPGAPLPPPPPGAGPYPPAHVPPMPPGPGAPPPYPPAMYGAPVYGGPPPHYVAYGPHHHHGAEIAAAGAVIAGGIAAEVAVHAAAHAV
ncbi:sporulation protein, partial [Spirillospora sp. NPDC049652]